MRFSVREIKKVAVKYPLKKQPSDWTFWQTRSFEERLESLEKIRQEYHAWKTDIPPRFQRVYRIVKRK